MFESYNNWLKSENKMGGKAVKNVRPLNQNEMQPTYEWVEQNILPLLYLDKKDAIPIGSFGKKPKNETSGDIDIAINANKFMTNGLKFEDIATAIDYVLNEEEEFNTTLLKGFDQVSVSVPINGDPKNGYAQVDLMPSPDLNWAKFMYHSPNLSEEESKYKGAVRNALMMALISESTKEITKLFEGKTEEYNSLAIRFSTGVWNIKRSLMGKKGKIIKKGVVLESEFITREPQDVIDLAIGEGYGIAAANSFETLWEVIHRKGFIHKSKINEIISKFAVNLKSMRQDIPNEALIKYPEILREDLKDVLKPKTKNELKKASQIYIKNLVNKLGIDEKIIKILYDNNYLYDVSGMVLCDTEVHWFKHKSRMPYEGGYFGIDKNTLFKNVKKDIEKYNKGEFEPIVEGMEDILVPKSLDDIKEDVLNKINSGEINLDLLYKIHNKISLDFIPKHILTDLILSLSYKKIHQRWGNTFQAFKKNYSWIKEYLTKDLFDNILVKAAYKDLMEKYPSYMKNLSEPKTLKEIREIEKNIKFEKERTSFLRFFNLLKGDSSYKSIQRIIQLRINKNQFKFLVFIFDLIKYHKNSYHTLNYIEKIYNLMDGRIKEISRTEFRILLANKQWGLEWIDDMIGEGLLDFFKRGNKQFVKLNTNYEDPGSYSSYNYNYRKIIEYLTDQIEKFGIKDINEDVKDLFKSKTKEELEEATDVYIKKLALRIGIGWALVEYLYKAGYRYDRTDRLQNHWFKHKTLDSSSGGHYALNKYTAYQDIKKYVDKWTKGLNENLNKNNITILYPGAFKPITGAHIDIIKRYLNQSNVEKVVLFISPGKRDEIDADLAYNIAKNILKDLPVEIVLDKKSYSPILAIYRWIEKKEREPGKYALASSTKENDYKRVKEFVKNYKSDKFRKNLPKGVKIIELPINVDPLINSKGEPISATKVREDLKSKDYNSFKENYPEISEKKIKYIWNQLIGSSNKKDLEEAGNTGFVETGNLTGYERVTPSQKYKSIKTIIQ